MNYKSTSISSKWTKTNWLLEQKDLRKYVPRTMLFNKGNLISMLSTHDIVYFKPTNGSGGTNIIRIKKKSSGYQTQFNKLKKSHPTVEHLYDMLLHFSNGKSYLLQKGIRLARTKGKPFDIRVMVQKTNKGKWVCTAIFTKIGVLGKVATNYNQGGAIGYFQQTMSNMGYSKASIQRKKEELELLGISVGNNFDIQKNGFMELGLDVALDSKGKLWILEVNTRPQIYPLKNMKDKSLYQKIISYAKHYRRFK